MSIWQRIKLRVKLYQLVWEYYLECLKKGKFL